MRYICPVCNRSMERDLLVFLSHTEGHIVDEIKKSHPSWVGSDGICRKCHDFYRKQIQPEPARKGAEGSPGERVTRDLQPANRQAWIERTRLLGAATRAHFLPASLIPFFIGALFARSQGYGLSGLLLAAGLLGVAALHLAGNVFNDYFDHVTGADQHSGKKSPFFGGSRVIQGSHISPATMVLLGLFLLTVSLACGSFIIARTGDPLLLAVMLIAGILAVEYTAPPLRLAYRKLGELVIFLLFGTLLVMGSFYLFSLRFTIGSFLISLPVSFLIFNVIICNEIPDFGTDRKAGKDTLISLTGKKKGYLIYACGLIFSMAALVANIVAGLLPPASAFLLAFYGFGLKALGILKDRIDDEAALIRASALTLVLHSAVGLSTIVLLLIS